MFHPFLEHGAAQNIKGDNMKKSIKDFDLNNKKVIIRVDFNVPMKDGKITDDNRIRMSLKTINYAIENGAKVILMSHLGRVKTEEDKKNSLEIVAKRLSEPSYALGNKIWLEKWLQKYPDDADLLL